MTTQNEKVINSVLPQKDKKDYESNLNKNKIKAFDQMQAIAYEIGGFADLLDLRQENMKHAEFYLSEHLIRLIRRLDAIATQERELTAEELENSMIKAI